MPNLVGYILLFLVVGSGFIFVHLLAGKLIRPAKPDAEKLAIYECGEPTIGSAWIQFDLRFYVVALLFVIFDVEVAFFFPWAVVFGKSNTLANSRLTDPHVRLQVTDELVPVAQNPGRTAVEPEAARKLAWIAFGDIAVFFGVLLVGFAYLWRRGDLDWVRSTATERTSSDVPDQPAPAVESGVLMGAGHG